MFMNEISTIFFVMFILSSVTQGYKLKEEINDILSERNHKIAGDDDDDDKSLDSSTEVLLNYLSNNANLEHQTETYLKTQKVLNRPKRILVKRIVKHGVKTPQLQDINMLGFFYKPFVRVHSQANKNFDDRRKVLKNLVKYEFNDIFRRLGNDNEQQEPKALRANEIDDTESENVIKHLIKIDTMVKQLQVPLMQKEWRKILKRTYSFMAPQVEQLHNRAQKTVVAYRTKRADRNLGNVLRTRDECARNVGKILRKHCTDAKKKTKLMAKAAKGALGSKAKLNKTTGDKSKPTSLLHKYIWSDWANEPQVPVDVCPGETVQHGNVCVELPPHRLLLL